MNGTSRKAGSAVGGFARKSGASMKAALKGSEPFMRDLFRFKRQPGQAFDEFMVGALTEAPPATRAEKGLPSIMTPTGPAKGKDKFDDTKMQPPPGQPQVDPAQQQREAMRAYIEGLPDKLSLGSGSSTRINPMAFKSLERGQAARQQYAAAVGAEGGAISKVIAAGRAAAAPEMERLQGRERATEAEVDEGFEAQRKAIAEVENAKIDPSRYFNDRAPINTALAVMVAGMGGVAEYAGTGKNVGLPMVNRLIERDIRAQEVELKQKRVGLQARSNMLGLLQRKLGNIGQAKEALHRLMTANIGLDIQKVAAQFQGTKKGAELEAQSQDLLAQAYSQEKKVSRSQEVLNPLKAAGMAGMAKGQDLKRLSEKTIDQLKNDASMIRRLSSLRKDIKGKNLSKVHEVAAFLGTDAGNLLPRIDSMARSVYRSLGTDKGNLALAEGNIMTQSVKGGTWGNRANQALKRLLELSNEAAFTLGDKIRTYRAQDYKTAGFEREEAMLQGLVQAENALKGLKSNQ